jgi:hypothetical protein
MRFVLLFAVCLLIASVFANPIGDEIEADERARKFNLKYWKNSGVFNFNLQLNRGDLVALSVQASAIIIAKVLKDVQGAIVEIGICRKFFISQSSGKYVFIVKFSINIGPAFAKIIDASSKFFLNNKINGYY